MSPWNLSTRLTTSAILMFGTESRDCEKYIVWFLQLQCKTMLLIEGWISLLLVWSPFFEIGLSALSFKLHLKVTMVMVNVVLMYSSFTKFIQRVHWGVILAEMNLQNFCLLTKDGISYQPTSIISRIWITCWAQGVKFGCVVS